MSIFFVRYAIAWGLCVALSAALAYWLQPPTPWALLLGVAGGVSGLIAGTIWNAAAE
jgi:hypothetical protein